MIGSVITAWAERFGPFGQVDITSGRPEQWAEIRRTPALWVGCERAELDNGTMSVTMHMACYVILHGGQREGDRAIDLYALTKAIMAEVSKQAETSAIVAEASSLPESALSIGRVSWQQNAELELDDDYPWLQRVHADYDIRRLGNAQHEEWLSENEDTTPTAHDMLENLDQ